MLFYLFFFSAIVLSVIYHYYYPEDLKFNIARLDEIDNLELWFSIEVFVEMLIYFSIGVMSYKLLFKINKNDKEIFKIKLPKINIKKIRNNSHWPDNFRLTYTNTNSLWRRVFFFGFPIG